MKLMAYINLFFMLLSTFNMSCSSFAKSREILSKVDPTTEETNKQTIKNKYITKILLCGFIIFQGCLHELNINNISYKADPEEQNIEEDIDLPFVCNKLRKIREYYVRKVDDFTDEKYTNLRNYIVDKAKSDSAYEEYESENIFHIIARYGFINIFDESIKDMEDIDIKKMFLINEESLIGIFNFALNNRREDFAKHLLVKCKEIFKDNLDEYRDRVFGLNHFNRDSVFLSAVFCPNLLEKLLTFLYKYGEDEQKTEDIQKALLAVDKDKKNILATFIKSTFRIRLYSNKSTALSREKDDIVNAFDKFNEILQNVGLDNIVSSYLNNANDLFDFLLALSNSNINEKIEEDRHDIFDMNSIFEKLPNDDEFNKRIFESICLENKVLLEKIVDKQNWQLLRAIFDRLSSLNLSNEEIDKIEEYVLGEGIEDIRIRRKSKWHLHFFKKK